MAIRHECDRCGRLIDTKPIEEVARSTAQFVSLVVEPTGKIEKIQAELCWDCMQSLVTWLRGLAVPNLDGGE